MVTAVYLNGAPTSLDYHQCPIFPSPRLLTWRRPIFGVSAETKQITSVRAGLSESSASASVIEKQEFEFKPTFDEYLKAMESAKLKRTDRSSRTPVITRKMKNLDGSKRRGNEEKSKLSDSEVEEVTRAGVSSRVKVEVEMEKQTERKKEKVRLVVERFLSEKKKKTNESELLPDVERAAFKPLEENVVVGKHKTTRVDMEERIQKLAKNLNGAEIDIPEWKFSQMMRSAQIRYSDHSITRVIQILGKFGNWRRVLQVIEWLQSSERFKSHNIRYIYSAALDALGKARRPVEALNLFRTMEEHMSSYPDLAAYHSIAVTLGQAGHMKELFDVIDTMQSPPKKKFKTGIIEKWDPRLEPDVIVYNAVLNACVRRKKWEGAFWVLQQLKLHGQQPSSATYGLVMEVMYACGRYNLVHDFFKKVQKSCLANALTYKVLVNTLWKEGKTDEAVLAVKDMERRGIVGNAGLYYDLARCLCSAGRIQDALKQIDKICKVASKPLVVTYTGLIQVCLDSGDISNGAYIFKQMQKFCSPNLITCNIMLKAYLDHQMFEEAKSLFLRLLENGNSVNKKSDYKDRVSPDIYTFNTMLDICYLEQRWDDLELVYTQMLRYGHHFNAKRHLQIVVNACRAGKKELLDMTLQHLVQADRVPPALLIRELFCMKLEQGDHVAALSCFTNYPSVELQVFSHRSWLKLFTENAHRFQRDTLATLLHEASDLMSRNENLILHNLIISCKEILKDSFDLNQT